VKFTEEKYEDDVAQYHREYSANVIADTAENDEAELYDMD
jgi:hypothetical protein